MIERPRLHRWTLIFVVAAVLGASACTSQRELLITEVGVGVVELYLNEPADHRLALRDHTLTVDTLVPDPANPGVHVTETSSIELVGTLDGGRFVVVWEEPGHVGPPRIASYQNFFGQSVDGIAVAPGSLPRGDNALSYGVRVSARRYRYIFPFFYAQDRTDDLVTFGPRPRPVTGGDFLETGALDAVMRSTAIGLSEGESVWRKSSTDPNAPNDPLRGIPRESDSEDDWRQREENFGMFR
jgi:hypothetical protein